MDRGVIATAGELFEARHYPSVVAVCSDALDDEPECLPLVLLRARAHIALRRDLDAQADLRDAIRLDGACGLAYRLLGVLAARRDEHERADRFFREALRLDPGDREAHDWLQIVASLRPAALTIDDRPTKPFARGSDRDGHAWTPRDQARGDHAAAGADATPPPLPPAPVLRGADATPGGLPPVAPPARPAPPRPTASARAPELPGFGEYLVSAGILSRERLRAAQAYQRSMRVQLATAIVTLGLATPQRIEWAAVAHQAHQAQLR